MRQTETRGLHPIYIARFLAVSRMCLFVNFANLTTVGLIEKPAKAYGSVAGPYLTPFSANRITVGLQNPQNPTSIP